VPGTRRSGRKPLPTRLKQLRGSRVSPNRAHEPQPERGTPACPPTIATHAPSKAVWDDFAQRLAATGVLTIDDQAVLAAFTTSYTDYLDFVAAWDASGRRPVVVLEFQDASGKLRRRIVANPLVKTIRDQARLVLQFAGELGLSPAARPRVQVQGPDTSTDDFDAWERSRPSVVPFPPRMRRPKAG
jgi:P27 family predicted phage terminase small subunit